MMKHSARERFLGGVLMLLLAGGTAPAGSWAANGQAVAVPPPEPTTVSAAGPKAKAAPATVAPTAPAAKAAPSVTPAPPAPKGTQAPAAASPATPPSAAKAAPAAAPAATPAAVSPGSPNGTAAQTASPASAATAAPASPPYRYQPEGKADPFVPFIELDLAAKKQKEEALKKRANLLKVPVSPLQQADIERFRLVGIAGDELKRMAIVEDAVAKKYYPLVVGTIIGLNGGRVVSILPDRVIVEERFQDQSKKVRKTEIKRIPIMLHKEEEGKP